MTGAGLHWRRHENLKNQSVCSTSDRYAHLVFLVSLSVATENKSSPSKKELKVLIANAKTPAEHQEIAAYYRDQSRRLTASAKEHAEMAGAYAKNPVFAAMESKHGSSFGQGASHCCRWAQLDEDQAKEAEALAALHRRWRSQQNIDRSMNSTKNQQRKCTEPRVLSGIQRTI